MSDTATDGGEERHDPCYWEVTETEKDRDVTNPDTGDWEG